MIINMQIIIVSMHFLSVTGEHWFDFEISPHPSPAVQGSPPRCHSPPPSIVVGASSLAQSRNDVILRQLGPIAGRDGDTVMR